ncbi:hypothetical protein [Arenibaculum pallidiluteum]|uniref:hypothetical protein n=1 Tax=Arenibaculum pallidiluteum TaxID=2812559 RepID=UPI001A960B93|nr:hypothetical protein [Arenibaculum pallidiluteum]
MPSDGAVRLSDVLEPLLNAAEGSDEDVEQAVGLVAEALAALGVLVVEASGQPVPGASDEKAVLAALNTYARMLVRLGRMDDAIEVTQLMTRIGRLESRPRDPRPPAL